MLDAPELYGQAVYLSATQFKTVLKRVIHALAENTLLSALADPTHLHIAYAFHDEELCWTAEVEA